MATERTYTVPLRPGFRNAPKYYRTNKAMSTLRAFLVRHMKVKDDNIKIGQHLNELLWKHGIKNPPPRVTITVKKTDDGVVTAELVGQSYKETVKPQAKTEAAPSGLKERLEAAVGKKGAKEDATPEEPAAEAKPAKKKTADKPDIRKAPQPKQQKQGTSVHEE
jgi:large subunit ribosomal protein L31e